MSEFNVPAGKMLDDFWIPEEVAGVGEEQHRRELDGRVAKILNNN